MLRKRLTESAKKKADEIEKRCNHHFDNLDDRLEMINTVYEGVKRVDEVFLNEDIGIETYYCVVDDDDNKYVLYNFLPECFHRGEGLGEKKVTDNDIMYLQTVYEGWNLHDAISLTEAENVTREEAAAYAAKSNSQPFEYKNEKWKFNKFSSHYFKHCFPVGNIKNKAISYFTDMPNMNDYAYTAMKAAKEGRRGYIKYCEDSGHPSKDERDRLFDLIFLYIPNADNRYGTPADSECNTVLVIVQPNIKSIVSFFPINPDKYDPDKGVNWHRYGWAKPWQRIGNYSMFENLEDNTSPVIEEILSK